MDKEQAIKLIRQVCAAYRGTLQDHQQILLAIKVLEDSANGVKTSESDIKSIEAT